MNEKKNIQIILEKWHIQELDRIAERTGRSRSDTIRTIVGFGLDVYRDFERIGIVRLAEIFVRAEDAIREKIPEIEERKPA